MAIEAIFFDAAGTLIKPARRVGESYALLARLHGIESSAAQIGKRFRDCFQTAPPLAFPGAPAERIPDLEFTWWKELVRRIFEPWHGAQRFDDYFAELFAYFAQPEAWLLYPETGETLSALNKRGLRLSVISNFDSRLVGILRGLGIADRFEHILVSSRVGYAKPDREIFDLALQQHDLKASEALHVGDSEEKDLNGANQAGLRGVLVERDGDRKCNLGPRITSLRDILSLLDELDRR
jgi:putative hydrolase of the HAD superfamily